MGKITYADKVGIVPKEVHVNQWWDDDANELKGAVNDNDDRITVLETGSDTLIDVSAEWTSGLSFNVTADNFPVDGTYYSNTASVVTLDAADPTLDRIDLIVANKNGTNGFVKGTAATNPAEPDFDPSEVYPIKFVLINGAATAPSDTSTELLFDENLGKPTEWTFSKPSGNISVTTNDAFSGTKSVEATSVSSSDYFLLTNNTLIDTTSIGKITFYIKLKEALGDSYIFVRFFNGTDYIQRYFFNDGQNGLDGSDITNWQKISIDGNKLNLPNTQIDIIQIYAFKSFAGYYFDLCEIHEGSGSEPIPTITPSLQQVTDVGNTTTNNITTQGYASSGTRSGGDINVGIGDYDSSGHSNRIEISDYGVDIYSALDNERIEMTDSYTNIHSQDFTILSNYKISLESNTIVQISGKFKLDASLSTPLNATDTGEEGEIRYDSNYIYMCVATNTWKRTSLNTW